MEQQLDGERRSRGGRVVGDVAWTGDELLRVFRGIEEGASLLIPEPLDHRIGDLPRTVDPALVERQLVNRDESKRDRGVILEEAADSSDTVLVRAHHSSVAHRFRREELGVANGKVSELRPRKN